MPTFKALLVVAAATALPAAVVNAARIPACGQAPSHADQRACYEKLFNVTSAELRQAENQFLEALTAWDVESEYKQRTKTQVLEASKQFSAYRVAQCEVAASLAAGGNGAGDMRLSCMIEATRGQIAAIRSWAVSLK